MITLKIKIHLKIRIDLKVHINSDEKTKFKTKFNMLICYKTSCKS